MKLFLFLAAFTAIAIPQVYSQTACNKLVQGYESFVCVCDSDYCDYPGIIDTPTATGEFLRIVSDRDNYRFDHFPGTVEANATGDTIVHVSHVHEYQKMHGFGGAFTDSTGYNIVQLPQAVQDHFVNSYFAPEGIEYSVCRIPIAGSDFSTRPYSYDDVDGDIALDNFALEMEDFEWKLPFIQQAVSVSRQNILLFGSPWAPPAWMKENGMANGTGGLLKEMWDPFADYMVKFVQTYESHGLTIWGITPQNEPLTGFSDWAWNTCAWNEVDMRDWIVQSFGPKMEAAGLRRVKVMLLDHNRDAVSYYPYACLENEECNSYTDGTAVHWYNDANTGPEVLSALHAKFPEKFILYTESCEGWYGEVDQRVHLGEWERAQNYANNILEDINHFSTGWVDWNMALGMDGGPNWAGNLVDSPMIVNSATGEIYKQPMFYAMGHFSKFIQRDALNVYTGIYGNYGNIAAAAFHNPNGTTTYVVLNKDDTAQTVSIETDDGMFINIDMTPKSLESILIQSNA